MTEWRAVRDCYEVSDDGRVRSMPHVDTRGRPWPGKELRPYKTGKHPRYLTVNIARKNEKIHRLVAEAFLPIDDSRPHVNHKNGNREDNSVANLEWCTPAENVQHAYDALGRVSCGGHIGKTGALHHASRAVLGIGPNCETQTFGSAAEAARLIGSHPDAVSRVCNGIYKHTKGWVFRYAS